MVKAVVISLLLCALQGVSSYVFSCDEIKSKLLNSQRTVNTVFACVFFEEGLDPFTASFLNDISLQDELGKTSYSFAKVAASGSHCVRGEGAWSVVSEHPSNFRCDKEIALVFSSDEGTQYVQATSESVPYASSNRMTVVSPGSGIKIAVNNLSDDLVVSSGAGSSLGENLHQLKYWSKSAAPKYIASFDNVLTIESNSRDALYYVTSAVNNVTRLGPGDHAAILTSGESDNIMNKRPDESYATYDLWAQAQVNISGSLSFDKNYQGSINVIVRGDSTNEERSFKDTTIDYIFSASFFEVQYLTSVSPDVVSDSQDTFVIEIKLNEAPGDVTPVPSIRTDPPRQPITTRRPSTQSPVVTAGPPATGSDRYCNCAIVDGWFDDWDPSDIWVDVVILLDTSASMGDSLEEVIYNLNMSSTDDLDMIKQHNVDKIDVGAGVQAALKMFGDGTRMPSYRENTRQIIYYLTNSAPGANMNGINDFKTGGGIVIVNDFVLEGGVPIPGLKNLATDNYFFTDLSENFISSLGLFCEANCFCNPNHHAFNDDKLSPRTDANRGCFHPVANGIPFAKARETCLKTNSSLVSIHDTDKEYFVSSVVATFGAKKRYWIAYENDGTNWVWDDKSTDPFNDWDQSTNQPDTNGGTLKCAYAVNTVGLNVGWTATNCAMGNFYVCESVPCSAGNNVC